jgi:hypothetical protein
MANNKVEDEKMLRAYESLLCQCSDGGAAFWFAPNMSSEQRSEYWTKVCAIVDGYKQQARELLTKHRRALDVLARALMSPALGGSVTDGIVSMIIENPEAVNEQLDAVEAEMKKQHEERLKKQQEEYDRMMNKQMDTVNVAPMETADTVAPDMQNDVANLPVDLSSAESTENTAIVDQSPDTEKTIEESIAPDIAAAEPLTQENAEESLQEAA